MVVTKLISETVVLLVNLTAPGSRTNALIRAELERGLQRQSVSQSLGAGAWSQLICIVPSGDRGRADTESQWPVRDKLSCDLL